jgi:hypothetical protein
MEPAMTLLILCFVDVPMLLIESSAAAQEPKRLQALDRRRSKEDKELRDKLQPFARLFSAAEFEKIYQGFVGMVSSCACPHSSRHAGMVCSPDSVRWRWLTLCHECKTSLGILSDAFSSFLQPKTDCGQGYGSCSITDPRALQYASFQPSTVVHSVPHCKMHAAPRADFGVGMF